MYLKVKKVIIKSISIFMLFLLVFSVVSNLFMVDRVEALDGTEEMQNSMINFFREMRTEIDPHNLSFDEYMVYGVFLSNFFLPGKTTVGDIKDIDFANNISSKFFGTGDNGSEVQKLNEEVYNSIKNGLGGSSFELYRDSSKHNRLSGRDFLILLSEEDKCIYTSTGGKIDFSNKVMESIMKVLFAYSPDLIFDEKIGLRGFGDLYIDGYGNIWGMPIVNREGDSISSPEDDFVVILPACLNPIVFSDGGSLKFPVSNVFVMGAVARISDKMLDRSDTFTFTPYYSIRNRLYDKDQQNLLNIYGVTSPITQIGNSDSVYRNYTNNFDKVRNFVIDSRTAINERNSVLLLAVDVNKLDFLESKLVGLNLSDDEKSLLVGYFMKSNTLALTDLADDMYYFRLSGGASNSDGASWVDDDDGLLMKQKLFTDNSRSNVYSNSMAVSPFVSKYFSFINSGETSVDMFIDSYVNKGGVKYIEELVLYEFKNFLSTGRIKKADFIETMFNYFMPGKNMIFNFLILPEENRLMITKKNFWESFAYLFKIWLVDEKTVVSSWGKDYVLVSYGLTAKDSHLIKMGYAVNNYLSDMHISTEKLGAFVIDHNGGYVDVSNGVSSENSFLNVFSNFLVYKIFGMNEEVAYQLTGLSAGESIETNRGSMLTYNSIVNEINNWPGIYWGYMTDMLNISKDAEGNWVSQPYSNSILPGLTINTSGGGLNLNDVFSADKSGTSGGREKTFEEMQKDIIRKINGLLSTDSNEYRSGILKAAITDWVISTHRDLTGSWIGNVLSVSTGVKNAYASIVGYINTPSLYELPFTAWLLDNYMKIYVFLLLLVTIILVMMFIANIRTLREIVLIFLLMTVALVLPQTLLNNAINISNTASNAIYSGRFNFWAIMQHQQSFANLMNALSSSNPADYNITLNFEGLKNVYSGDDGVRVKWMTPKKDDIFKTTFTSGNVSDDLFKNLTIFKWLFSSFMFQEEYVYKDPFVTYLYRPYNAIAQEAKDAYDEVSNSSVGKDSVVAYIKDSASVQLDNPDYCFNLIDKKYDKVVYTQDQVDLIDVVSTFNYGKDDYRYWGIANSNVTDAIFRNIYENDDSAGLDMALDRGSIDAYAKSYLLYTESPFYYFYNVLKYRYGDDSSIYGGSGFSGALLLPDIFIVMDSDDDYRVNGKMRDFLDMEGLFTHVVPYLKAGNNYVYNWTSLHGRNIERYDFDSGDSSSEMEERFRAEQNKKERLHNVWNMYAPWVDSLYDLDVYNGKAGVANKRIRILDTLNPGAYDELGRSMIWSEADMYAKSYRYSDLSDAEIRIQRVLKSTFKDMMYLVNYYDFNDEVLITAAAMMATFNFNREFSKPKLIGQDVTLYPQSFELKNFNYDAFLRLVLMNVTGESVMGSQDLYIRVLEKTSWFTGLLILVLDVLAIIVIPALKTIVLLMLLFLGLLMCISCVVSPPEKLIKSLLNTLVVPILLFLSFNIVFAYLVSLFVGEGFTSYVGGRVASITVNDPTVSILLLIIVSGVYTYCLMKLVFMLINSYKSFGTTTFLGVAGLAAGAFAIGQSYLKRGLGKAVGVGRRIEGKRRHNELVDAMRGGSGGIGGSGGSGGYGGSGGSGGIPNSRGMKDTGEPIQVLSDLDNKPDVEEGSRSNIHLVQDKKLVDDINRKAREFKAGVGKDKEDTLKGSIEEGMGSRIQSSSSEGLLGRRSSEDRLNVDNLSFGKRIGRRMVDFEFGARDIAFNIGDKVVKTSDRMNNVVDYVVDKTSTEHIVNKANMTKDSIGFGTNKVKSDLTNRSIKVFDRMQNAADFIGDKTSTQNIVNKSDKIKKNTLEIVKDAGEYRKAIQESRDVKIKEKLVNWRNTKGGN